MKKIVGTILPAITLLLPGYVSAHEQYVLTEEQFNNDYAATGVNVWSALSNPDNFGVIFKVSLGIMAVLAIYFFLTIKTPFKKWLDEKLAPLESVGHVLIRVAVGLSFIYSAATMVYLGPEILESFLPFGAVIHYGLYILGFLMIAGLFSELVGFGALITLALATWVYKDYMLTYFNYFGEFFAMMFFGSRTWSLDRLFFGIKQRLAASAKDWEILILRVTYGISILYPAITLKFFHPTVIVDIVNRYHLNEISWLFPRDPLLISLGTGMAQVVVGLFIIFGFETRLASLTTLVLYVLSIAYFNEAVWPHYILLALSAYLVINDGGRFTLDRVFLRMRARAKREELRTV